MAMCASLRKSAVIFRNYSKRNLSIAADRFCPESLPYGLPAPEGAGDSPFRDLKPLACVSRFHRRLPHVVDFSSDVRVMPHNHLGAGVPQHLGYLSDTPAVDQGIRGQAV